MFCVPLSQAKLKLYPEQMDQFRLLGHAMKTKLAAILTEQRRLSLCLSDHIRGHATVSMRQQMAGGMQVRCAVDSCGFIWYDKGTAPEYVAVLRLCEPDYVVCGLCPSRALRYQLTQFAPCTGP